MQTMSQQIRENPLESKAPASLSWEWQIYVEGLAISSFPPSFFKFSHSSSFIYEIAAMAWRKGSPLSTWDREMYVGVELPNLESAHSVLGLVTSLQPSIFELHLVWI